VQVDPTEAQSLVSPAAQELIATRLKEDHHIKNAGERERKDEMNNSTSASDSISTVASVACTRKGSRTSGSASRSPRGTIVVAIRAVIHGYYGIKVRSLCLRETGERRWITSASCSSSSVSSVTRAAVGTRPSVSASGIGRAVVASIRAIVDG